MFKSEDIAYKVQDSLQGKAFNIDEHQAIFTYLLAYYEKGFGNDTSSFMNFIDDPDLQRIVAEIEMMDAYDYVVENDDIQTACDKINAIVLAEHLKRERVAPRYKKMLEVE